MTTQSLVPHTGESTPPPARFPLVDGRASLDAEVAGVRDTDAAPLSTVERRSVTSIGDSVRSVIVQSHDLCPVWTNQ